MPYETLLLSIEDHIANCIVAMQANAETLGLQGTTPQD